MVDEDSRGRTVIDALEKSRSAVDKLGKLIDRCFRRARDLCADDRAEIRQECFRKIWEQIGRRRIRDDTKLAQVVMGIAANAIRKYRLYRARRASEAELEGVTAPTDPLTQASRERELLDHVASRAGLRGKERRLFYLVYEGKVPLERISVWYDIKRSAAVKRNERLHEKLEARFPGGHPLWEGGVTDLDSAPHS